MIHVDKSPCLFRLTAIFFEFMPVFIIATSTIAVLTFDAADATVLALDVVVALVLVNIDRCRLLLTTQRMKPTANPILSFLDGIQTC